MSQHEKHHRFPDGAIHQSLLAGVPRMSLEEQTGNIDQGRIAEVEFQIRDKRALPDALNEEVIDDGNTG